MYIMSMPDMSRRGKRERRRSRRSGSRSLSPGPRPLGTARASFPACRSGRLTCGDAGRSEAPKAQALDSPFHGGPIDLGPVHAWIATVCRWLRRPYRSDRVSHGPSSFSSYSISGKSAPFQVRSFHPCGWPYPSDYRRAFASSHILYPLGIGPPCGRLSRLDRPPMGVTVFHQLERQTP
jgi:hypothetical protein